MSKTFVLMHGAWHGGWCWGAVADSLRVRGHRVTTPTQTGLGERRHLISKDLTLQTFIDDMINHVLAEDLTDVTLVGHSFGGNAVSGTAEALPDRVAQAIYLDCTILMSGERMVDMLAPGEVLARIQAAADHGNDVGVPPPDISAFGVLDPDQAGWAQPRLTPHPISTMLSPLPIKGVPGNGLPARYIACTEPQYQKPERVRGWADQMGWPVTEIATGHDAMITDPVGLVEVLDT